MIRILINGIGGQMGHAVYNAIQDSGEFTAAAGVDRGIGAAFDCPVYERYEDVKEPFDAIIDFSVPAALPDELRFAQSRGVPLVIGTTGLTERLLRQVESAAEHIAVFQSGNMSLGVNLQMSLVRQAASALGASFDVEIVERHHRKKVDAPSGTALMLADSIASQSPSELEYVYGRQEKNRRRSDHEIGFHSVRGGTIVGEHEVLFIGKDEVVEIAHRAYSKRVFAEGALRAAKYLLTKSSGLYSMENIVTEHDIASHVYALDDQAVVTVACADADDALPAAALDCIAAQGVFVDMISCSLPGGSSTCLGFSLPEGSLSDALNALKSLQRARAGLDVHAESKVSKLTIEGSGMAFRHGIASRLLNVLHEASIPIHLITTSETKIELCVSQKDAITAIHEIESRFLDRF